MLADLDARPVRPRGRRRSSPRPAAARPACPHHDPKLAVCDRCVPPGADGWPAPRRGRNHSRTPYRHCSGCGVMYDREGWREWEISPTVWATWPCSDRCARCTWAAQCALSVPPPPDRWHELGRRVGRAVRQLLLQIW